MRTMPSKKQSKSLTAETAALTAIQFAKNKDAIKSLEATNKKLREPLEDYLTENGSVPNEEAGHRVCVLYHADQEVVLKYTHRVSAVLQPDAIDILKREGITEPVETIEVVREDVIQRLYDEGRISDELLKELYAQKSSDAFSVTLKDKFHAEGI